MKTHQLLTHAILTVALGLALTAPAVAQSGEGDPPARVGRLAQVTGAVSFHSADENKWQAATLNYPVTSGSSFWTEPDAHAAIDMGAGRIYLDGSTELDIGTLGDQSLVASLPQGIVFLRVPDASANSQYEIDTPRGAVHITEPGRYEIVAGDTDNPTRVVAFDGSAQIIGQDVNTVVAQGQVADITGQDTFSVSGDAAQQDDFSQYVQNEERPYYTASQAPAYVSPQETGYQDLGRYGQWQQTPNYGPVWMPQQVAVDWAPYRDGHWAYVVPWGWTWVDNAPWGFTPFHYGRWVQYQSRWAWMPGEVVQQPVYAPALVNFFGGFNLGGGVSIGIALGSAVGWVPLGPEEVYVPPYHSSPRYIRNVNITNIRNETTITNVVINNTVINNYINRNAMTVVSADAMANSRQIGPEFKRLPKDTLQQQLTKATPLGTQAPVKPTYATSGVTPTIAKKIGAVPAPTGVVSNTRLAPGPVVTNGQVGSNGLVATGQLPALKKKGSGTATISNGTGANTADALTLAPSPAAVPNGNATSQNATGHLPALKKKGNGTATGGNGSGSNTTGAQTATPGPAIIQSGNATSQNGTGQLPALKKKGNATATTSNGTGTNTAGAQTVAPGPAVIPTGNATSQNGTGQLPALKKKGNATATTSNGTGTNTAGAQTAAPGPAVIPTGNATSQNGTGQLPALKKKGNATATTSNGTGTNTAGAQTAAPGPAINQSGNATSQNGTGQLPALKKKSNGTATVGNGTGTNTAGLQTVAPGPAVIQNGNASSQNTTGQLPALKKKGNGTATVGNGTGGNLTGAQTVAPGQAVMRNGNATSQNGAIQPLLKKVKGTAPDSTPVVTPQ